MVILYKCKKPLSIVNIYRSVSIVHLHSESETLNYSIYLSDCVADGYNGTMLQHNF